MRVKKVLFLLVLPLLGLCGCNDKNSGDSACHSDSFQKTCVGLISFTECVDGTVITSACSADMVCREGACVPVQAGERVCGDDYVSECRDNAYTICIDGQLSTVPCLARQYCEGGKCVSNDVADDDRETPVEFEKPAIPETCNEAIMQPYCYDNIRLSCKSRKIVQEDCGALGLVCHYGDCMKTRNQSCTPVEFKSQCVGNTLVYCDPSNYSFVNQPCGDMVCATVGGAPGCYLPCDPAVASSGEGAYCWDDAKYVVGKCVESDEHLHVIADFRLNSEGEVFQDCEYEQYCSDGRCVQRHDDVGEECYQESFVPSCDSNIAYTCEKDWFDYEVTATACGAQTCVIHDGKAECLASCSSALNNITRQYCRLEPDNFAVFSITEVCQKIDDSFYWVPTDRKKCSGECNEFTGECINSGWIWDDVTGEGMPAYREKCDASAEIERYRCKADGYGDHYGNAYFHNSVLEVCENGFWSNAGEESCVLNGCDGSTGKCIGTEEELQGKCFSGMDRCAYDGYVVMCEFGSNNMLAVSCGNGKCAQTDSDSFDCVVPCTEDQVGKYAYSECLGSGSAVHYECVENPYGVGEKYYMLGRIETCKTGCAHGACKGKLHPDEGVGCSETYIANCHDTVSAYCSGWSSSYVNVRDCKENDQICAASEMYNGCYDACTEADSKVQNLHCETTDSGDVYSRGRTCLKDDNGVYFWTDEVDEYCLHGCDEKTGECILIHEMEKMNCHSYDDSKCDGKYKLYCNMFEYSARDCEELEGPGGTCAMLPDSYGDLEPTCIQPCDQVGATKAYCKEADLERQLTCVQKNNVKLWEDDDSVYERCEHGCDPDTGKCIKLSEHENEPCENGDPDICDGSMYLTCSWSNYVVKDCDEGLKCVLQDGDASCLYPCEASQVDETRDQCGHGWDGGRLYKAVCTKFENGYFWKPGDDYIKCEHGCDASVSACKKLVEDEYSRCDINTYKPYCIDNYLVSCDFNDNKVHVEDCGSYEVCIDTNGVRAACYRACDASEVGTSSQYCSSSYAYREVTTCKKIGSTYAEITEKSFCTHGCSDDHKTCEPSPYEVGKPCESLTYARCADDTHLYRCVDDVIVLDDCAEGTQCVNGGWSSHAYCETPACKEGDIRYSCDDSVSHTSSTCYRKSSGKYEYGDRYHSGSRTSKCEKGCDYLTGLCY